MQPVPSPVDKIKLQVNTAELPKEKRYHLSDDQHTPPYKKRTANTGKHFSPKILIKILNHCSKSCAKNRMYIVSGFIKIFPLAQKTKSYEASGH